MGLLKSKLMLRLTLAVSVFGVAVGGVSTMAWFQINTSANNIDQGAATRNLTSTATVYQDNDHSRDDNYSIAPVSDAGKTLSYDHAKGGKATNYYLRFYTANDETHSLQMFSNITNNADKAVYYNIAFDENFKIYNASTNAYLGYSNIDDSCLAKETYFEPQSNDQNDAGRDNIHPLNSGAYFDIYVTKDDLIWIAAHTEETTSAEMGNETGYYIYGTNADANSSLVGHNDVEHGIPMYVNAAKDTHDKAFYAGLRLSVGDTFYLVSGDSTEPYKQATDDGLLNDEGGDSTDFNFNLTTGLITCRVPGYYCIALNSESKIHMTEWDGMEVDGTTRYTIRYNIIYRDQGDVSCTADNTSSLPKYHTYGSDTALTDGAKDGFDFDGWYTNSSCTGDPISSLGATAYTADITLYAKWTETPAQAPLNANKSNSNVERKARRNAYSNKSNIWIYTEDKWNQVNWANNRYWSAWDDGTNQGHIVIKITACTWASGSGYTEDSLDEIPTDGSLTTSDFGTTIKRVGSGASAYLEVALKYQNSYTSGNYKCFGYKVKLPWIFDSITYTYSHTSSEINDWEGTRFLDTASRTASAGNQYIDYIINDQEWDNNKNKAKFKWSQNNTSGDTGGWGDAGTSGKKTNENVDYKTAYFFDASIASSSGSDAIKTVDVLYWTYYDPTAVSVSRTGRVFDGWYTSYNSGTGVYGDQFTGPFMWHSNEYWFLGKYTYATYTISYNYASGSAGANTPTSGTFETELTIPNPSRTGYTFAGWTSSAGAGLNTSTAKYGSSSASSGWNGSATTYTKFKNLRSTAGTVTLTATWNANTYTIAYDYAGGTKGANAPTSGTYDANVVISNPTKAGYTFAGWTASGLDTTNGKYSTNSGSTWTTWSNGATAINATHFKNLRNVSGTITLTATWTPITYSISYDYDGGSAGTNAPESAGYDTAFEVSKPTKTGYVFTGWEITGFTTGAKTGASSGSVTTTVVAETAYGAGASSYWFKFLRNTATDSVTLTATWTAANEVTFEMRGHGGDAPAIQYIEDGNPIVKPTPDPTETGWTFGGWYDASNDTLWNFSTNIITDKTLYALWTANTYTISYNYVSGSPGANAPTSGTYDTELTISNPTRTGYTFAGWTSSVGAGLSTATAKYGSSSASSSWDGSATTYTKFINLRTESGTVTLTATWTKNTYTIAYDYASGTKGANAPTSGTYDTELTISNPTRTGYTFAGWTSSVGAGLSTATAKYGSSSASSSWDGSATTYTKFINLRTESGTVTLTATWNANSYTVTLNRNNGTGGTGSVSATYGSNMPSASMPTRTGYTFAGYFDTDATSGGTQYYNANGASARTWNKASATTLWARWTANTYTIAYDYAGGTKGANAPTSGTYDDNVIISNPTKAGATFAGWIASGLDTTNGKYSTNSGSTWTTWSNGATAINATHFKNLRNVSGTITLTATWTEATGYYAIVGSSKGGWSESGDGAVIVSGVTYSAETVTFEGVSFANGETWKIKRPAGQEGYWGLSWWGASDLYESYSYFSDPNDNNNISTNFIGVGTYNITLTLETGKITITPTSLSFYFKSTGTGNNTTPTSYSGNTMTWTNVTLDADTNWHIEGPNSEYVWGYKTSNRDNITATSNYGSYFTQGTQVSGEIYNCKNFYGMVASSIVFDYPNNTINVTIGSITSVFKLKNSSGTQLGSNGSATGPSGTVTFSNVSIGQGVSWRMSVEGTSNTIGYSGIEADVTILGQSKERGTFFSDSSGYANTVFGGTYTITYNVISHKFSTVSCTAMNASNFTLYHYYWNGASSENQTTVSAAATETASEFTFTVTGNGFIAGYMWHITGPSNDHIWGYKTGGDNISAMDNYEYWFADSDHGLGDGKPEDIKNLYTMSCTVTFDFLANSIVVSGISLKSLQFTLTTNAGDNLASASASAYNGTVTFTNVALPTATPWQLRVDGTYITYDYSAMPAKSTILGLENKTTSDFFYTPKNISGYIGTGWGGTYTLVYNVTTHQFTSVSCSALASTDIKAVRGSGSVDGVTMTGVSTDLENHTATFSGTTTLFISETIRFVNTNTATTSEDRSCVHDYYFWNNGQNILTWNLNGSDLLDVNTTSHLLHSRVHAVVSYTVTWYASDTHATFAITGIVETNCTKVAFTHAEDAGIYLETTTAYTVVDGSKVANWSGATKRIMMHTTSGLDSAGKRYLAQEAPIYTAASDGSPLFMRVVVTHSNYFNRVPSGANQAAKEADMKYLTEYYYVYLDTDVRELGFDSAATAPSANNYDYGDGVGHGNGPNAYIIATSGGTWTVSYRDNGTVHIEKYTGAATVSTEHEVPYYLIGRGMPGSPLRECDFTTAKGINLWTYGGNSSTMPCYVGAYGGNTSSGRVTGEGIHLKKGDTFALASVSKQLLTFASSSNAHFTIDNSLKVVTINDSGLYQIYLSESVGSEEINVVWVSADSESTRSGNIIARNGITPISSSGNTLTLGGNLDYSLLDATSTTGYSFVVQFDHVSTGAAGAMDYKITNGNTYSIKVEKKDDTNASATAYAGAQTITSSDYYTYTNRTITASTTTYTCIRVTIPAEQLRAMISSGNYTFNITISYTFTESNIATL